MKPDLKRRALTTGLILLAAALIGGCGGGSSHSAQSTAASTRPEVIGRTGGSAPAATSPTSGGPSDSARDGAGQGQSGRKGEEERSKPRSDAGGDRSDPSRSAPGPEQGQGSAGDTRDADGHRAASNPKPTTRHPRSKLAELVGGRGDPADSKSDGATESGAGVAIETGAAEAEGGVDPGPAGSGVVAIVQEVIGGRNTTDEPRGGGASVKETVERLLGGQ
jgi:hypothetical protein